MRNQETMQMQQFKPFILFKTKDLLPHTRDFPGDLKPKITISLHCLHMGYNQPCLICTFRDMIRAERDRNQASDRSVSHLSGFVRFRFPPKKIPTLHERSFSTVSLRSAFEGFLLISCLPRKICIIFFNGSIVC